MKTAQEEGLFEEYTQTERHIWEIYKNWMMSGKRIWPHRYYNQKKIYHDDMLAIRQMQAKHSEIKEFVDDFNDRRDAMFKSRKGAAKSVL